MAHRALLAYQQATDRYDVHTARWGGLDYSLATRIGPGDPYAGGVVDAEPRVRECSWDAVLTMVDAARHEALYRVEADWTVRAYLPLWVGLGHYLPGPVEADREPSGLLVAVESERAAAELRAWLRAAKGVLADAVAAGYLDEAAAESALVRAARERAGDREVVAV